MTYSGSRRSFLTALLRSQSARRLDICQVEKHLGLAIPKILGGDLSLLSPRFRLLFLFRNGISQLTRWQKLSNIIIGYLRHSDPAETIVESAIRLASDCNYTKV